jgi:thiamine transport system ATP-binding protein
VSTHPALRVRGLSVSYDGVPAVCDASLDVGEGQVLAVLGPSGCGKSTLLRAVAGLEQATGSVTWNGTDVSRTPTHKRGFALMFQDGQLFPHLSVAANVGYPLRIRRSPGRGERVAELLDLVGLSDLAARYPGTLSGGERQRVALARALAAAPRLLLLDEPLSALDAGLRERLAEDVRRILLGAGTTAVMVTHDHDEAFTIANSLAVMRSGRIVQAGPIGEVWRSPADADTALFLGYARVLQGSAAARILAAGGLPTSGGVALRRSALAVADAGPIAAQVLSVRATPEQVRLVCATELGEVDAVASLDHRPAPGDRVQLRVDASRLAPLGARGSLAATPLD